MFYGTAVWDPALIIAQVRLCVVSLAFECVRRVERQDAKLTACGRWRSWPPQIVAVQSLFYVSLGFLLLLTLGACAHAILRGVGRSRRTG